MYRSSALRRAPMFACAVLLAVAATALAAGGLASPARADGPGTGSPWTVSVGDSYISGEAGRWAGSTNESSSWIDALGSTAYDDNAAGNAELVAHCHRSKSAEVYIGGGVSGENLACSGAKTYSFSEGEKWKPGLDFYNSGGKEGQALMLQNFAKTHNVKLVAVSIGGNNFNFASIVQTCVEDFLESTVVLRLLLQQRKLGDEQLHGEQPVQSQRRNRNELQERRPGDDQRGLQPLPVHAARAGLPGPDPARLRLPLHPERVLEADHGRVRVLEHRRELRGRKMLPAIDGTVLGAANALGLSNVRTLELASAFNGRRLCEKGVGLLEEEGLKSWKTAGAVDKTEWVNEVRTVSTIFGPYEIQEDIHPNYWGQLALRNCLTQAYNGGTPKGGTCTISATGLNAAGEPNMSLH